MLLQEDILTNDINRERKKKQLYELGLSRQEAPTTQKR